MNESCRPFPIAERIRERVETETGYIMTTPENKESLEAQIEEKFGKLSEIEYSEDCHDHNYWNVYSPFFVSYRVVAFNPLLCHALFEGHNMRGDEDYYVEYLLMDSEKKSYAKREFIVDTIGKEGGSSSVSVKYVDGDYREVYDLYKIGKKSAAKPVVVEIKKRPSVCDYLDYDGESLAKVAYYKGKPRANIMLVETDDASNKSDLVSFIIRGKTVKAHKTYGYSGKDIGIKKFGEVFDGEDVAPYAFTIVPVGEGFAVRRINIGISDWTLLIPKFDPDIQTIMIAEGLDWVNTCKILPVKLDQKDQRELPEKQQLPFLEDVKGKHIFP